MLPPKFATLFTHNNYRFSTKEGRRETSLYFEDSHGNQGRWRREHPHGELLIYQGRSARFFCSKDEMGDFIDFVVEPKDNPSENPNFDWHGGESFMKEWMDVRDGISTMDFTIAPTEGRHVVELCPPLYYVRHCSSGTVRLGDATEPGSYDALKTYSSNLEDWTLLR